MVTLQAILFAYQRLMDKGLSHEKIVARELEAQMNLKRGIIGSSLRKEQKKGTILDRPYLSTYAFKYAFKDEINFPAYFYKAINHYNIPFTIDQAKSVFRDDMPRDPKVPILDRTSEGYNFSQLTLNESYLFGILSRQGDVGLKGGLGGATEFKLSLTNRLLETVVNEIENIFKIHVSVQIVEGKDYSHITWASGLVKYFSTSIMNLRSETGFFNLLFLDLDNENKYCYIAGVFDMYLKINTNSNIATFNDNAQIKIQAMKLIILKLFNLDCKVIEGEDRQSIMITPSQLREILLSENFSKIRQYLRDPLLRKRIQILEVKIKEGKLSKRKILPHIELLRELPKDNYENYISACYENFYIAPDRIMTIRYYDKTILSNLGKIIQLLGEKNNYQFKPTMRENSDKSYNLYLSQSDVDHLRIFLPFNERLEAFYSNTNRVISYRDLDLTQFIEKGDYDKAIQFFINNSTIDSKRVLFFTYHDTICLEKLQTYLKQNGILSTIQTTEQLQINQLQISPGNVDKLRNFIQFPPKIEKQYERAVNPRFDYKEVEKFEDILNRSDSSFNEIVNRVYKFSYIKKKRTLEIRFLGEENLIKIQLIFKEKNIKSGFDKRKNYISLVLSPTNLDKLRDIVSLPEELEEQYQSANTSRRELHKHKGLESLQDESIPIEERLKRCMDKISISNDGGGMVIYNNKVKLIEFENLLDRYFKVKTDKKISLKISKSGGSNKLRISKAGLKFLDQEIGFKTEKQRNRLSQYMYT